MDYFTFEDRLFEFTTLSPSGTDDWVVECAEISASGGFFGTITVAPVAEQSTVLFSAQSLPLEVLSYWISILPDPITPLE
jgi:hypothetical protein